MADTRKQYPYGADNVPVGYVLTHYADGAFWVDPEPKWETALTVEGLIRALRRLETSDGYTRRYNQLLIAALISEEE